MTLPVSSLDLLTVIGGAALVAALLTAIVIIECHWVLS
jgi:hypothetical protein